MLIENHKRSELAFYHLCCDIATSIISNVLIALGSISILQYFRVNFPLG